MPQSRTLSIGRDGPKSAMAVTYVAKDHDTPRRRAATARRTRASSAAGPRRRPIRWSPPHGDQRAQPPAVTGAASSNGPHPAADLNRPHPA
jgi:hypothetical protein